MKIRAGRRGDPRGSIHFDDAVQHFVARRPIRPTPNSHAESASRPQSAPAFGKSAPLVGYVAHADIRHDDVKGAVIERKVLRVRFDEGYMRQPLARELQHGI